jgi:hypothetical protein
MKTIFFSKEITTHSQTVLCKKSYNIGYAKMLTEGNFYKIIPNELIPGELIISTNSSIVNFLFSPEEMKEYMLTIPEIRKRKLIQIKTKNE